MNLKSNVWIEVNQKDLLTNEEIRLFTGVGYLSYVEGVSSLVYQEDENTKVEVGYDSVLFTLTRTLKDSKSTLLLVQYKKTEVVVNSQYGDIKMMAYTHDIEVNENSWFIEYDILTGKDVASSFWIEFKIIKKLEDKGA